MECRLHFTTTNSIELSKQKNTFLMPFYYAHAYTHISYYQLVALFDSDPCYFSPDSSIFLLFIMQITPLCVVFGICIASLCVCCYDICGTACCKN